MKQKKSSPKTPPTQATASPLCEEDQAFLDGLDADKGDHKPLAAGSQRISGGSEGKGDDVDSLFDTDVKKERKMETEDEQGGVEEEPSRNENEESSRKKVITSLLVKAPDKQEEMTMTR